MKNESVIIEKKLGQIKELLAEMDCYSYSDSGIRTMLGAWLENKRKLIEDIAEKSPYYDGECKIVMPNIEYPREFNVSEINSFCYYLRNYAYRNGETAYINGFDYPTANSIRHIFKAMYEGLSNPEVMKAFGLEVIDRETGEVVTEYNYYELVDKVYKPAKEAYDRFDCGDYFWNGNTYVSPTPEMTDAENLAGILESKCARTQFVTDELAEVLNRYFTNMDIKAGTKLSRVVNKIATKCNLKDAEWEREFAKYADAVNPMVVKKWTVISFDPIDYLTSCFGNCWSSCMTIDKKNVRNIDLSKSHSRITSYVNDDYAFRGESASGTLSYMLDNSTMVFYTVNEKYDGTDFELQPKESRCMFSISEDYSTLLQSRMYPQCNDDGDNSAYDIPRDIVQRTISSATDTPNLWHNKKGNELCMSVVNLNGTHYPDYEDKRNHSCNVSWKGDVKTLIKIGANPICPKCGTRHTEKASLNCYECDPFNYRDDDYDEDNDNY